MTELAADTAAPHPDAEHDRNQHDQIWHDQGRHDVSPHDQSPHGYPALRPALLPAATPRTAASASVPIPAAPADEPAADEGGHSAFDRAAATSGRVAAQMVDRLRNNAELTADRGTTIIANEVVEKIAGIASRQVAGVYDLGGDVSRVFSAVKERIGLGQADGDQGVSVRLDGGRAAIKVTLVIEYGFVVYSVTEKVRINVIDAIENLLGLDVTAVDIVVDDVHVTDGGPAADEPTAGGARP